ncbi:hypothetical protein DFH27DRAFT_627322 [Peziza echinospora]|nr:hypothetical protein DFH27DRAFT_627322 [Peziza echinospora]
MPAARAPLRALPHCQRRHPSSPNEPNGRRAQSRGEPWLSSIAMPLCSIMPMMPPAASHPSRTRSPLRPHLPPRLQLATTTIRPHPSTPPPPCLLLSGIHTPSTQILAAWECSIYNRSLRHQACSESGTPPPLPPISRCSRCCWTGRTTCSDSSGLTSHPPLPRRLQYTSIDRDSLPAVQKNKNITTVKLSNPRAAACPNQKERLDCGGLFLWMHIQGRLVTQAPLSRSCCGLLADFVAFTRPRPIIPPYLKYLPL